MHTQKFNWRNLSELCQNMHRQIYVNHDRHKALALLPELHAMLKKAPKSSVAIILAESRAIYHELNHNIAKAIFYRQRELALMERLYSTTHNNDAKTRKFALQNRSLKDFAKRKAILKTLLKRI